MPEESPMKNGNAISHPLMDSVVIFESEELIINDKAKVGFVLLRVVGLIIVLSSFSLIMWPVNNLNKDVLIILVFSLICGLFVLIH